LTTTQPPYVRKDVALKNITQRGQGREKLKMTNTYPKTVKEQALAALKKQLESGENAAHGEMQELSDNLNNREEQFNLVQPARMGWSVMDMYVKVS
jgi:hypothetical protein